MTYENKPNMYPLKCCLVTDIRNDIAFDKQKQLLKNSNAKSLFDIDTEVLYEFYHKHKEK